VTPIAAHTILVVDDSPTQLSVLRDALTEAGLTVETARNGVEAISRVYSAPPSLILSDVLMPELNGYHLCRLLKNDPATSHIPVILLTNLREPIDRFWGEKAGADRYLEKGSDFQPIIDTVLELLAAAPAPTGRPLPGAFPEPSSSDIRSRVTEVLDKLLYDSTLSNEILKLTGLAHDTDQLARELLRLLSVLCNHRVAALMLNTGRDKYALTLQTTDADAAGFQDRVREEMLRSAGLNASRTGQVRVTMLDVSQEGSPPLPDAGLKLLQSLPIIDEEKHLATIALYGSTGQRLGERTRHALGVVADRFLIVARYLKTFNEIEEVKSDFVSMLVHDLRSPLTSIRGFADVLAEGILGSVSEEQGGALKNIQSGCDRLLLLIEDMLDLAKIEAGMMQIHPAPLNLTTLAEKICDDLTPLFRGNNLELRLDIPHDSDWVLADGKQLARVLTNLLANAVKFTRGGGRITLAAGKPAGSTGATANDRLMISITDTGPGIPKEQQPRLFERYHQLPSTRMFRKGTGLGLAICKEIITLHCGEIWVESPVDENGGSRFCFTLPLA